MFAYEVTKTIIGFAVFGAMLAVVLHAWAVG